MGAQYTSLHTPKVTPTLIRYEDATSVSFYTPSFPHSTSANEQLNDYGSGILTLGSLWWWWWCSKKKKYDGIEAR